MFFTLTYERVFFSVHLYSKSLSLSVFFSLVKQNHMKKSKGVKTFLLVSYAQIICTDILVWCEKSISLFSLCFHVVSFSVCLHDLKDVNAANTHLTSPPVLTVRMK